MWIDPIVEEVRKNREELASQFNFDLRSMVKALQETEKTSERHVVSFAREPVKKENLSSGMATERMPE